MPGLTWVGMAVFLITNVAFFVEVGRRARSGGWAGVQDKRGIVANWPYLLGWLAAIGLFLAGASR